MNLKDCKGNELYLGCVRVNGQEGWDRFEGQVEEFCNKTLEDLLITPNGIIEVYASILIGRDRYRVESNLRLVTTGDVKRKTCMVTVNDKEYWTGRMSGFRPKTTVAKLLQKTFTRAGIDASELAKYPEEHESDKGRNKNRKKKTVHS